ncbi:MAG: hydroxyacylglutathione hydrolase [Alphaproteobacteria bacterium]|nr:hydroxyacylglutathione hydrolase [Alphaproteobacteria bacterium]
MKLLPIPAFDDNYLWLMHDGADALVVDPGAAPPVQEVLQRMGLNLKAILVTHHHADHVGGVVELLQATGATVYGPEAEDIPGPYSGCQGGQVLDVLGVRFEVIDVPGHTAGHVAYFAPALSPSPLLFCGDTLFSGGCGRLFEGTPAQMLDSLDRLAALPDDTRVCCAHEYTLSNLRFAVAVEPGNADLLAYQSKCIASREQGVPTLPSSIGLERRINPFLRSREAAVAASVRQRATQAHSDVDVFGALREWKTQFR